MPPDLALSSTLIGSNYPCLELIFMVPKVFEPLKFDCISTNNLFVPKPTVPLTREETLPLSNIHDVHFFCRLKTFDN